MLSSKLIFGICTIVAAFIYSRIQSESSKVTQRNIISAWQSQISMPKQGFSRVTAGVNTCLDLIVPGKALLQKLNIEPAKMKNHNSLSSYSDLQETFHYFFNKGSAAERYFANSDVFHNIVEAASSIDSTQWYVGGNAALIAQKIAETFPSIQLQLVGPVGPKTLTLLHKNIHVPHSCQQAEDEVHLIMEFQVGERWGDSTTEVATRFITSNDESNRQMKSLDTFFTSIGEYKPDLVIFSGFHMLDGQNEELQASKLEKVAAGFEQLPSSLPLHLELASMAEKGLMANIFNKVVPKVTALGLNEQELSFASHVLGGPHSDLFMHQGQPAIYKVTDIITWLLRNYGYSEMNRRDSSLTRIHFHSLTYHIIGSLPGVWDNIPSAVAAGTKMAAHQACDTPILEPEDLELRIPLQFKLHSGGDLQVFNPEAPVISFQHGGFHFSFSPVLVCKVPLKTVGLGDAISATGLLYSTYNAQ